MQKMLPDRQIHLSQEWGFVHVPSFDTDTSFIEELHKFRVIFRRREKTILSVYLLVFLLSLFFTEAINPNLTRNFTLSFILGICLGLIAGFIREGTDAAIKNRDMLARVLPLPLLGIAPAINRKAGHYAFQTADHADSMVAHAFRSLRNNLMVVTQQKPLKVLNVTSTDASEGKSSTTINLATAFTQAGKKVLLIDADLRRPTLHKHFGLDNTKGLGNYLAGMDKLEPLIRPTRIPGLHVITSGPITPHAVELLSSDHLKQLVDRAEQGGVDFDLVMIDSPPVLGLADALLIGNRTHATLFVVACNETRRSPLRAAYERLLQARSNIVGVVMTKVR
ncbi:polysaccharide biosynthesis tyrosine autokinase [Candidatus Thiothrix sp. Deng01]|uniref:Polysaccharide biosynthesis tyrosine autokinase n=1 Tax=Candidatus Thiothrix phosphatis TaxID=3112415 RepID=A0ABU6D166_9GAMM|nr:polysaccharide biosynthesis tyrosine autokinase [Candidatus Thiothrix sp. Deng01]MEB4592815.1 polysaccharide biosynthesis tyrosine autokinase [Candidatus Thiothrix sp. Deng01]